MKKLIIGLISIIVVISAIIVAFVIYKPKENNQQDQTIKMAEETIIDDCTDEYEASQNQILETNAEEEKVSPNASLTIRTYYEDCGHTTSEYKNVSEELVNKTKKELKEMYNDYEILKFTDSEIVLEKSEKGDCGEHYIVRDKDGKVAVYQIETDGTEGEYEITDISIEYLTATDRDNIEKGITVNGKQDLNQLIEDFE